MKRLFHYKKISTKKQLFKNTVFYGAGSRFPIDRRRNSNVENEFELRLSLSAEKVEISD